MIVVFPDHSHTLDLFITNGIVSSKIDDKRNDFKFGIVNVLFLDGDFPRSPLLWCMYFAGYTFFVRVCFNVSVFNNRYQI